MRKNNRDRILKTARQLLPRYGYNGISIRAIASRAKLTTGAIYFHFRDKMDIYKTICFEAIDMLIHNFRDRMQSRETPSQKLISTFDSYIDFFYNHQDYYNILMEYKAHYDPDVKDDYIEVTKKLSEMYDLMEDTIRAGIRDGSFREIDPRMLSVLLAAVTEGMLQLKKLGIFDYMKISDDGFRKFMGDTIGMGILNESVKTKAALPSIPRGADR